MPEDNSDRLLVAIKEGEMVREDAVSLEGKINHYCNLNGGKL